MIDHQQELQQNIIKQLLPRPRQLLPLPNLLSTVPKFVCQSRPSISQNYQNKYQALSTVIKRQSKQIGQVINIKQVFKNSIIYQKYKQLNIFSQQDSNFNFVRFPLQNNKDLKIENERFLDNHLSDNLIFNSEFQCANLAKVSKISNHEYNLLLQNDINTFGYNQWFYFKVKNIKKINVKFNIINMYKRKSLYQNGMRLTIFSTVKSKKGVGWQRGGEEIQYYPNNFILKSKKYYTLSWKYNFLFQNDEVYFAYNYPYTYTDLNIYLDHIEKLNLPYVKRKILCSTISGNRVDYLSITQPKQNINKKYILLSARVHPGQTVSSFMMKGIIDYLISNQAQILRQKFIFRLVPMLNPDGVINGNYRCSLSGSDLNRKWKNPSRQVYPQIYSFKKMILKIANENRLELFCDLHGHSIKKSIFFYGCGHIENPYASRQFPFIMSKISKNVNFRSCNFKTQKDKTGTARISLYNATNIPRIYTIQSSFCGPCTQQCHYTPIDYQNEGKNICKTILIYSNINERRTQIHNNNIQESIIKNINQNFNELSILNELYNSKQLLEIGNQDTSGSDSNPSQDDVQQKYICTKTQLNCKINLKNTSSKSIQLKKTTDSKQEQLPNIKQRYKFFISEDKEQKQKEFKIKKEYSPIKKSSSNLHIEKNTILQRMPKIKIPISPEQKIFESYYQQNLRGMNKNSIINQIFLSQQHRELIKYSPQKKLIKLTDVDQIDIKKDKFTHNKLINKIPFTINVIFEDQKTVIPFSQRKLIKRYSPQKVNKKFSKASRKSIKIREDYLENLTRY